MAIPVQRSFDERVPAGLASICTKALARDPAERYPDASFVPTEDSGIFEMTSTFREDAAGVAQQFSDMARSCRDVFEKIVEDVGAECVVNDHRTE